MGSLMSETSLHGRRKKRKAMLGCTRMVQSLPSVKGRLSIWNTGGDVVIYDSLPLSI